MKYLIGLLFAALLVPASAEASERHLFILSGQSNMAGLKPESAFLPELKKLLPDADIQHVKFAKGGQPIRKWVDTDDTNNKEKKGKMTNDLHYTKDGYDLFGRRLARQAVRIIQGEKPDAKGKPE